MISVQKNKIKTTLLIVLIIIVLFLIVQEIHKNGYIRTISLAINGQKEEKELITGISINNVNLIYDYDNDVYYFPIKLEDENKETQLNIKINFSEIISAKIENKLYGSNIKLNKNLNYNTVIEIEAESLLYKNKKCIIKFTNIPIISMNFNEDEVNSEEYTYSQFSLTDPDYKEHSSKNQFYSDSEVRYRGASSSIYEKKSYRIKLEKNNGSKLLGLNKNRTWILDAMASDDSKLRTKIASDLWNNINEDLNSEEHTDLNSKFIELYVNGSYKGLYLLKETIDERLLNLDNDSGILIKGIGWEWPDFENYDNIDKDTYACFELKYPKKQEKYSKSWNDILSRLKDFYNSEVIHYDVIDKTFYIKNLINQRIFLLVLDANDNYEFRNIYCSIKNDKDNTKILITPWDLDLTFGLEWDNITGPTKYYDRVYNINEPFRIRNDEIFIKKIKERWKFLRDSTLSKDLINDMIDIQYEYLTKAGTLERENNKNKSDEIKIDTQNESQEIKDWYNERVEVISRYIETLE